MLVVIKHNGNVIAFSAMIAEYLNISYLFKGTAQECNEFIKEHTDARK